MLGFVGKTTCSNNSAVVQSLIRVWLYVTPCTAALQASLSFTNSWVCSDSCTMSWGCYLTISSSVAPFSFCPQSFPASGSFPMSWLLTSGDQSIGASASSVLPVNVQGWFPLLVWSPCSPRDSQSFLQHHNSKASILWCSAFFMVQLLLENHSFDYTELCQQSDISAF